MELLYMGLVGFAAGTLAKMITPQKETGGWISTIIIGILGSIAGSFIPIGNLLGDNLIGRIVTATGGAFILLWIYHKYLADKLNIKI